MFCPKCESEFREGYTVCSDCKVPLIELSPIPSVDIIIYAGFFRRLLAQLIDSIILAVIFTPIIYMLTSFMSTIAKGEFLLIIIVPKLFQLVILWLYYALMESSKNKGTLGKLALKIVVVDSAGNKLSFKQASVRFFSKVIISTVFYYIGIIGFIMVGFTKKKQGLHDMMANTYVVKSGYELELSSQLNPIKNALNV